MTADNGLKTMVPALRRAIEKDPEYDDAGPDRVMALVLVRAPGWPVGPGDPEAALEHAKKAVSLRPEYPRTSSPSPRRWRPTRIGSKRARRTSKGKALAADAAKPGTPTRRSGSSRPTRRSPA